MEFICIAIVALCAFIDYEVTKVTEANKYAACVAHHKPWECDHAER